MTPSCFLPLLDTDDCSRSLLLSARSGLVDDSSLAIEWNPSDSYHFRGDGGAVL